MSTFKILGISEEKFDFYHTRLKLIVKFITGFNLTEDEKYRYINAACEMEKDIISLIEKKSLEEDNSLLSFIMKYNDNYPERFLDSSQIVALTLNILLAASEPVDKVISLCIYHLYRNREYLLQLINNEISSNDILQETLRITPPVHLLPRKAVQDYITSKGDKINRGEIVFVSIPSANRDPEIFQDPNQFKPTREFKGHISYGYGIHTCIGAQFANMQLNLVLKKFSKILLDYEEKAPPIFSGIYTRGTESYLLARVK